MAKLPNGESRLKYMVGYILQVRGEDMVNELGATSSGGQVQRMQAELLLAD